MATRRASRPGEDAFDSLDWDPDLPSAKSPDESPEPVPLKPQRVAYTTVGSLVNPNVVPQFAAPNRIQREGANRRPLMSLLQGLQEHPTYRRGPPPPLNMSNSMHYAQQLSARVPNAENAHPSHPFPQNSRSTPAPAEMATQEQQSIAMPQPTAPTLSQQEKDILMLQYGTYPGRTATTSDAPSPFKRSALPMLTEHQVFNLKELYDEETRRRISAAHGAVQGLEKMQTLQRLAKFDNPMQQHARNRLSEFSVTRTQMSSTNPTGELNQNYQFPPPGIANPTARQFNPLLAAVDRAFPTPSPQPTRPPGYPQPLTAGPPGQRQAPATSILSNTAQQGEWDGSAWYNSTGTHQANNPWGYQHAAQIPSAGQASVVPVADLDYNNIYASVKVVDTLPPHEVEKYFPNGWPSNMTGQYTALSDNVRHEMDDASVEPTPEQRAARAEKERDDFFYHGQRRMWAMSPDDYMEELSARAEARKNGFGPIAPPRKKFTESVIPKKITIEEMNAMSVGDACAPMLDAAFGTLLALHDEGPDSSKNLSGFGKVDPDLIDPEPNGNNSLFGEDWGVPPKMQTGASSSRFSQQ
ncbi:hypothetical protein EG329_000668 [Mollisiaceae sp. DMI_Dod_QoI]|nr:hypothetical protein EG329_000668 [Helotiales sp. DMI_Dod_QoI]